MEKLGRILFISLDGEPPAGQDLDVLPKPTSVAALVEATFAPFLAPSGNFALSIDGGEVAPPASGLLLVYVFGHAWVTRDWVQTGIRVGPKTEYLTASELLNRLIPISAVDRTILILDCCHAAAFDNLVDTQHVARLVVYACDRDEKAISLIGEQASRLSLAFADVAP